MGAEQSQLVQLSKSDDLRQDSVTFLVNGKEHQVGTNGFDREINANYLLVDYLRDKAGLTGTKYMCREGGCGACIVTIRSNHPTTGRPVTRSVNSCLLPLFACDGLDISTVEKLGNAKSGYHPIQERLVEMGGTQCGFCTPGFVMNMYSVTENNPRFTRSDVENSMDSNICRCTGYRPIIEAFNSLSRDIEDIPKCPLKNSNEISSFEIIHTPRNLHLRGFHVGPEWFKVTTLSHLFRILIQEGGSFSLRYRLVAGNTGTGVYPQDGPYECFIDINDIPELHFISNSKDNKEMILGGGVTLTDALDEFTSVTGTGNYVWAKGFSMHFRKVASLAVRNRGTLAGNLMLKHDHPEFVSDVFTLFESVGATLKIASSTTLSKQYTLQEFLELDMRGKVILSIHLPAYSNGMYFYRCFKIGKRHQHSKAYVNSGMLFKVDRLKNLEILEKPSIVFGGINPQFVHASGTENFLTGKSLTVATLQSALKFLKSEAVPNFSPPDGTQEYRQSLAQAYLYKFMLEVKGNLVMDPRLKSGAEDIEIPLHTGTQTFDSDRSKWPLYQPIPKLESFPQVSGEAKYINDTRAELNELFGVFVVTTVGNAKIKSVDASEALLMRDVVAFITAKDIPGANNYALFVTGTEEIFVSSKVGYAGQPVGLLVARNKYAAFGARSLVKVTYEDIQKPVVDIRHLPKCGNVKSGTTLTMPCRGLDAKTAKEVLKAMTSKPKPETNTKSMNQDLIKVKGELYTQGQYHFHMETQICICVPKENGMTVYSSTQFMDLTQTAIANALNVPMNTVNLEIRRLGGGFGAKSTKANLVACAAAVASHVTNRPVRVVLDLPTNMQMLGKRLPYLIKYDAEVSESGKIHQMEIDFTCDSGAFGNETTSLFAAISSQSCYRADDWNLNPGHAETNTAPNTYCRAPGSSQGVAAIETIMEHIAHTVKKDPMEVRKVNFINQGDPFVSVPGARLKTDNFIPKMMEEILKSADYEKRKNLVEQFNSRNRWRKRGISLVPMRYSHYYALYNYPVMLSVYHVDGSVNICHGGIELGQGVNTKAAQVVASTLGISLDKIRVQPSNTVTSPNAAISAASMTSDLISYCARQASLQLLEKLKPIRELPEMKNATWEQIVAAAHGREILLTSQFQAKEGELESYDIWGITSTEVEVDILTGDYRIVRCDVLEDAGDSLSPLVDIGQVEGAFVMGLGWWLTEELLYDQETAELLTDNTWTYKPMMPADIPGDFRVTLLRNAPNPFGVLSSKATGEPPFLMSCSVVFALRNAINSSRRDAGNYEWYQMDGPVTREVIKRLALSTPEQFTC